MLHSIFHTVDTSHDDSMAEEMEEEDDFVGEEAPDDSVIDAELSPGVTENPSDSKDMLFVQFTKKFYCEDCSKFFTTNKTLRRHIRRIHNKSPPIPVRSPPLAKIATGRAVSCQDCGIWFSAKKNLLRHIRTSTTHKQRAEKRRTVDGEAVETIESTLSDVKPDIPKSTTDDVTESVLDIVEVKVELSSGGILEKLNVDENCIEDIKIEQTDEEMNSDGADDDVTVVETDKIADEHGDDQSEISRRKTADSCILKKYPCEECGQQFTKKSNVYRHMRRIHHMNVAVQKSKGPTSSLQEYKTLKVFPCEKCDQKYLKKCDMERHVNISHNSNNEVSTSKSVVSNGNNVASNSHSGKEITCEHCFQHFASRSNLLRHMRRQHLPKVDPLNATPKIKLKTPPVVPSGINQPFLVLDKHLRLTDYPFLKNMLPASYEYNLRCYSVLKENSALFKHKCFDATLQFHCNTLGESKYWVSLFEQANRLSFTIVPSQDNDANSSNYKCSVKGCPSLLIISTTGVLIQRKNVFRVTVRIVHKHNHQWDPPRLDLSQLVEAVIEEQDMMDADSERISVEPDPGYSTPTTTTSVDSQGPVMTLYFDKCNNSFVTQNVSMLTNGARNDSPPPLVLVSNQKSRKDKNDGISREFDAVCQFKRVCADMAVMIQQDPQYFAGAVQQFETSFDRVCSSKDDLLKALHKFGNYDGTAEARET